VQVGSGWWQCVGVSAYRRVGVWACGRVGVWACRRVGVDWPKVGRAELHPAMAGLVRVVAPRGRAEARPYRRSTYRAFSPIRWDPTSH
jgi:hypothetical protein